MRARVAGVDLGGTNCVAALVDDEHRVVDRIKIKTPQDGPDAVLDAVAGLVRQFDQVPAAVGVGVPSPVHEGVAMTATNLPGWQQPVRVGERLASALDLPVAVGNDANVGAVGEWIAGAGRGSRHLLGVWLGTGVGGGLVLQGRPYDGAYGGAGEFGHMIVQRGGALCGCGRRGCLEAYAGRASMERAVDVAVAEGRRTSLLDLRDERGKKRITSGIWAKALDGGDELATAIFDGAIEALGVAVGSAVNLLDLDRVVVGGGLAEKLGQPLADRIGAAAQPWMLVTGHERQVVVASLEDDAGVVGAATLARALVSSPA